MAGDWIDALPALPAQSAAPAAASGGDWIDALPDAGAGVSAGASGFVQPPNILERFGHGVNSIVTGAKQRYLMATDPAAAQTLTSANNANESLYQAGMRNGAQQSQSAGTGVSGALKTAYNLMPSSILSNYLSSYNRDVPSAMGSAAALSPTMLLPGGPLVGGALQGAAGGFLQPTTSASWGDVAKNTGEGAAIGGLLGKVGGMIADRLGPKVAPSLPADMQARVDAMKAVGIAQPPLPAITRSPQDWYQYSELGKQEGAPKDAYVTANQGYQSTLGGVLPGMQNGAGNQYANAEAARAAVQDWAKAAQSKVSAGYTAAQNAPGRGDFVKPQSFFDAMDALNETHGDVIPSTIAQRIAQFRQGVAGQAQAVAPRVNVAQGVEPGVDDIVTAVRKMGGINPGDEAVGSLAKANPFPPSPKFGPVWTSPIQGATQKGGVLKGLSLDQMTQQLYEHGYVSAPDAVNETMDKLADAGMGKPAYSIFQDQSLANQDPLASAISQLTDQLAQRNQPATPAARDFTVGEAAKLYDMVTRRMSGSNDGTIRYAGRAIKDALGDTFANSGAAASEAGTAFQDAVSGARQRFQALTPTPIKSLYNAQEANPNFFPSLFSNGKPGEIASLGSMIGGGAPNAVRDSLLSYLNDAATQSATGRFSGAQLGKAMDRVGADRLSSVLSPQDMAKLNSLRTASEALTVTPDLSGVNTSNTGSAIANLVRKIPLGPMAGTALGGVVGHLTGIPMVPEMIGAGLGAIGEHGAQKAAMRKMQGLLNPDLAALAQANQPGLRGGLLGQRSLLPRLLPLMAGAY